MKLIFRNKVITFYILISSLFFLLRIILFVSTNGGIEHDSGWYLGVARTLAETGKYASLTNTVEHGQVGESPSIHGRFSVQDKIGFIYFPAGVTVGPGYILPEATILKIFGNNWWSYRLWPLITFSLLIVSLFIFIYLVGGLSSLIIFQVWLYLIPQFYISYAFEAYSETIAFFYLFLSFIFYSLSHKKKPFFFISLAGLFFSFSMLTKNLFILPGIVFVPLFLYEFKLFKIKEVFLRILFFLIPLSLPILFYESYRYYILVTNFGISGWNAVNQDFLLHFRSNGSGLSELVSRGLDYEFILKKLRIWLDVGIQFPLLFWLVLLSSPFFIFRLVKREYKMILAILCLAMLISFLWFIILSSSGWARHIWQGLMIGILITSINVGLFFKDFIEKKKYFYILLLIILTLFSLRTSSIDYSLLLAENDISHWSNVRFIRGLEGFPSTPILSLEDQQELVTFFEKNIKTQDGIYYLGWFLNAEASAITNKIFFPIDRYLANQKDNSFLIIGPYQKGTWSFMPPSYAPAKIAKLCRKVVFENDSYTVCELKKDLDYINLPYN